MLAVLLLELLEGFDAAGYDDQVVGSWCVQEVLCDRETDAWEVSLLSNVVLFNLKYGVLLPREAPVTIRVLAAMMYYFCFRGCVVQECAGSW